MVSFLPPSVCLLLLLYGDYMYGVMPSTVCLFVVVVVWRLYVLCHAFHRLFLSVVYLYGVVIYIVMPLTVFLSVSVMYFLEL